MGLFILELANGKEVHNGITKMLVDAEDSTDARRLALGYSSAYPDGYWAGATIGSAITSKADYEGCRVRIRIYTPAGALLEDVTTAAAPASDAIADVMGDVVTLLNATSSIANAAYGSQTLTVAGAGDSLGDHRVVATFIPASGDGGDYTDGADEARSVVALFDGITDQGSAGSALSIAIEEAAAIPKIHAVFGDVAH